MYILHIMYKYIWILVNFDWQTLSPIMPSQLAVLAHDAHSVLRCKKNPQFMSGGYSSLSFPVTQSTALVIPSLDQRNELKDLDLF